LQCLLADNATNAAGFWTPQENGALLSALLRYGDDWDQVAAALENKTKGECVGTCVDRMIRERYLRVIDWLTS